MGLDLSCAEDRVRTLRNEDSERDIPQNLHYDGKNDFLPSTIHKESASITSRPAEKKVEKQRSQLPSRFCYQEYKRKTRS